MLKVLKFRYFLWALMVIGCGESTEQKQSDGATKEISRIWLRYKGRIPK